VPSSWKDYLENNLTNDTRLIAFYLPQYHPIPENDAWWGKGFTEWTNVTKARPNFSGHDQPHLPADLGFYDLRLPEARQAQADLARQYGVAAFCYYYYWFGGHKLLQRPIEEMQRLGQPDFPYCICWANESWTRTWDGAGHQVLVEQSYTSADVRNFIRDLLPFLGDPRYLRVHGRPLLLVYRISDLPDPRRTVDSWREEVVRAGLPDLYLCAVQSFDIRDPRPYGLDAAVEFPPHGNFEHSINGTFQFTNARFRGHVYDYQRAIAKSLAKPDPDYTLFRSVIPRWDNTARRQDTGDIFVNSDPASYEFWLRMIVGLTQEKRAGDERLVFINAWNEWGEGCHLEPDREYGHQYLEATRNAVHSTPGWSQGVAKLIAQLPLESAGKPLLHELGRRAAMTDPDLRRLVDSHRVSHIRGCAATERSLVERVKWYARRRLIQLLS